MNNTCTKVDRKMLQRFLVLYMLSMIYQRRVAAIVHERWLATRRDTAKHLKACLKDISQSNKHFSNLFQTRILCENIQVGDKFCVP